MVPLFVLDALVAGATSALVLWWPARQRDLRMDFMALRSVVARVLDGVAEVSMVTAGGVTLRRICAEGHMLTWTKEAGAEGVTRTAAEHAEWNDDRIGGP